MKNNTPVVDTIRSVAFQIIAERREQNFDNYDFYEWHVMTFFRNYVNMETPYGVKTFFCDSSPETNGIIEMPSDFLKTVSVAYQNGESWETIVYDSSLAGQITLSTAQSSVQNTLSDDALDGQMLYMGWFVGYGDLWANANSIGGARSEAYWNEDRERRIVIISPRMYNRKLAVRYMGYDNEMNGDTVVPFYYIQAAKAYVRWQEELNKQGKINPEYYHRLMDVMLDKAAENASVLDSQKVRDFFNGLTYLRA
jgi:hypothetical protein